MTETDIAYILDILDKEHSEHIKTWIHRKYPHAIGLYE
jgi:hypothetical protein